MAHDRWQRDKTGLTYLDGRGERGHVGFGFRTKKSRPSKYERGILQLSQALAAGAYNACPASHMCLNVSGSDRCKVCGARMGEWIPDAMLRCSDCCTAWSQDEYDARDGVCGCGGEIRSQR
jgi:hypothetical protein